jgi:sec-independent protein translocase protein TatA
MNIGDLFDSPWKILIIVVFFIVMFGSRKLPDAARSLGKSMRILKTEVQGLHQDDVDTTSSPVPAPAELQATAPVAAAPVSVAPAVAVDHQAQIDALSKQLSDLQQSVAVNAVSPSTASDSAQAK